MLHDAKTFIFPKVCDRDTARGRDAPGQRLANTPRQSGDDTPHQRLGERLLGRGLIDRAQLFEALSVHDRHGCRLGDALVWLGHIERPSLEHAADSDPHSDSQPPASAPPATESYKSTQVTRPLRRRYGR